MTTADIEAAAPKDGTGGGLVAMLDFCIRTGVLTPSTAKALRTGVVSVLSIEEDYQNVDVVNMDEEDWLKRFFNLRRDDFSDGTKEAYQTRFRQARAMYLARLNGEKDWASAGPSRASGSAPRSRSSRGSGGKRNPSAPPVPEDVATPAPIAPKPNMVSYPYPVRPGMLAHIQLPADLTSREAERIARFVASLAFDERLAITQGVEYAEIVEE